jgi:hypothetical protein
MKKIWILPIVMASLALAACQQLPADERPEPTSCPPKAIEDGVCVPQT